MARIDDRKLGLDYETDDALRNKFKRLGASARFDPYGSVLFYIDRIASETGVDSRTVAQKFLDKSFKMDAYSGYEDDFEGRLEYEADKMQQFAFAANKMIDDFKKEKTVDKTLSDKTNQKEAVMAGRKTKSAVEHAVKPEAESEQTLPDEFEELSDEFGVVDEPSPEVESAEPEPEQASAGRGKAAEFTPLPGRPFKGSSMSLAEIASSNFDVSGMKLEDIERLAKDQGVALSPGRLETLEKGLDKRAGNVSELNVYKSKTVKGILALASKMVSKGQSYKENKVTLSTSNEPTKSMKLVTKLDGSGNPIVGEDGKNVRERVPMTKAEAQANIYSQQNTMLAGVTDKNTAVGLKSAVMMRVFLPQNEHGDMIYDLNRAEVTLRAVTYDSRTVFDKEGKEYKAEIPRTLTDSKKVQRPAYVVAKDAEGNALRGEDGKVKMEVEWRKAHSPEVAAALEKYYGLPKDRQDGILKRGETGRDFASDKDRYAALEAAGVLPKVEPGQKADWAARKDVLQLAKGGLNVDPDTLEVRTFDVNKATGIRELGNRVPQMREIIVDNCVEIKPEKNVVDYKTGEYTFTPAEYKMEARLDVKGDPVYTKNGDGELVPEMKPVGIPAVRVLDGVPRFGEKDMSKITSMVGAYKAYSMDTQLVQVHKELAKHDGYGRDPVKAVEAGKDMERQKERPGPDVADDGVPF